MPRFRPQTSLRFSILLLAFLSRAAHADLVIEKHIWGFTDSVQDRVLQPLSVLVRNDGQKGYRGVLRLYEAILSQQNGLAEVSEPVAIEPGGARWVQFTPRPRPNVRYVIEANILSSLEIPPPTGTGSGRIRLRAEDEQYSVDRSVFPFPERLLPRGVSAWSTLRELVIDHSPELDAAQQRAFRDWLWLGGRVHLLWDGRGYPDLPGVLADFSPGREAAPASRRASFGSGEIVLHRFGRESLTAALLGEESPSPGTLLLRDQEAYGLLTQLTWAQHPWPLIYFLTFVLLFGVGPLNFWLARRARRYGIALATTLGIIIAFSVLFFWIGKAGQHRVRGLYTFTYARALADGYALNSWNHLFVTRGDRYGVRHTGDSAYYHSADFGRPRKIVGGAANGPQGGLQLAIPLYSSRQFTSSSTVRSDSIVSEVDLDALSFQIVVPTWRGAPADAERAVWVYLWRAGRLEALRPGSDGSGPGQEWVASDQDEPVTLRAQGFPRDDYGTPEHRRFVFESLARQAVMKIEGSEDVCHLLVLAHANDLFPVDLEVSEITHYALFHHVFPKNEKR